MRLTKQILVFCLVAGALSHPVARANTRVGSGGDVLQAALEETRSVLIQVLKWIKGRSEIKHEEIVAECSAHRQVDEEQRDLCVRFIEDEVDEILKLNENSETATAFEFWETQHDGPMTVDDVDSNGHPIDLSVIASTDPHSSGPIWFLKKDVQFLAPAPLLHLMAHEFGHKVYFPLARDGFIRDAEPMIEHEGDPAFRPWRGRALLDTAAAALVGMAESRRKLSPKFKVRDSFVCQFTKNWITVPSYIEGEREFTGRESNFVTYKAGFGYVNPRQVIALPIDGGKLVLKLDIVENFGCGNRKDDPDARGTSLKLFKSESNGSLTLIKPFASQPINLICEPPGHVITIEHPDQTISCSYVETFVD